MSRSGIGSKIFDKNQFYFNPNISRIKDNKKVPQKALELCTVVLAWNDRILVKKNIMKQNKNILTQSNQMKFWQNKFLKAEDLIVIKFCKKKTFLLLDMAYAGPVF